MRTKVKKGDVEACLKREIKEVGKIIISFAIIYFDLILIIIIKTQL